MKQSYEAQTNPTALQVTANILPATQSLPNCLLRNGGESEPTLLHIVDEENVLVTEKMWKSVVTV